MKEFDPLTSPLAGVNLIEASAGTGKTTSISRIFLRLLLEKGLTVDRILVVTFTEAATEELRLRIRRDIRAALDVFSAGLSRPDFDSGDSFIWDLVSAMTDSVRGEVSSSTEAHGIGDIEIGRERLELALSVFDEAAIYTIHGFCRRVLKDHAFESSSLFDTELLTDQSALLQELLDDYWRLQTPGKSRYFLSYLLRKENPDSLRKRIEFHLPKPLLEISTASEIEDTRQLEQDFENTHRAIVDIWPREKNDITDLLLNNPALNRRTYGVGRMRELLGELEAYLREGEPHLELPRNFEKLGPEELEKGTKRGFDCPKHPFCDLCGELLRISERLLSRYELRYSRFVRDAFDYTRDELPKRKQEQNVQYFDDLLFRVYHALQVSGGERLADTIRNRYPAALIDEFQDTDRLQYDIFRRIYPTGFLFLIGDPKQSIYSFRGADIYAYMSAVGEAQQSFTLLKNWRSEEGLIRGLNTLFSNRERPFIFEEIGFRPAEASGSDVSAGLHHAGSGKLYDTSGSELAPLQLWFVTREGVSTGSIPKYQAARRIMRAVGEEVTRLLGQSEAGMLSIGDRSLTPRDIAVLVRTNRQAQQMQKALKGFGVSSVIHSTESLFRTDEAFELQIVLNGLADPNNEEAVRSALATDIFGLSAEELDALVVEQNRWDLWTETFRDYNERWQRWGFMRMIRLLMSEQGVRVRILSAAGGERRLTNLLHLAEILHGISMERGCGVNGLLKWYTDNLGSRNDAGVEDASMRDELQLRLETDDPAVEIVTIHRSKGLDYPIIFCPFLWDVADGIAKDVVYHDDRGVLCLDLGSDLLAEHQRQQRYEEIAENLRLLYVALTRAKSRCYVAWGNIRNADRSALAYLLHPADNSPDPDEMIETGVFSKLQVLSDELIVKDLRALERQSERAIQVSLLQEGREGPVRPAVIQPSDRLSGLELRRFTGNIPQELRITSYSALLRRREQQGGRAGDVIAGYGLANVDLADHDTILLGRPDLGRADPGRSDPGRADETGERPEDIFAFPKGAKAGTFFHSVFEKVDFSPWSAGIANSDMIDLIEELLADYGFETTWKEEVATAVGRVMSLPLTSEGLQLCRVEKEARISEMEFLFPLQMIDPAGLGRVFLEAGERGVHDQLDSARIHQKIRELGFSAVHGFLKGFIDLVFRYEDRYYLVDWKSNHLGSHIESYHRDALADVMVEEYYVLQYHLYSLALHRYLERHIPQYDYRRHFGGVFYLFIRGIDPRSGAEYGLFRDRPEESLILALDRYMRGGER